MTSEIRSTRRNDTEVEPRPAQHSEVDHLVPVLYDELRRAARRRLRHVRRAAVDGDPSLDTTALVNEAYLKLTEQSAAPWRDRTHFMAVAALAMRQILIDRARGHARQKRGGAQHELTLDDDALAHDRTPERLLEINDALDRLAALEPRLARVVEFRFFGGMSDHEIAETLSVTARTVQRDWLKARALLRDALGE